MAEYYQFLAVVEEKKEGKLEILFYILLRITEIISFYF